MLNKLYSKTIKLINKSKHKVYLQKIKSKNAIISNLKISNNKELRFVLLVEKNEYINEKILIKL